MSRLVHQRKAIVGIGDEPIYIEVENAENTAEFPIETRSLIIEVRFESIGHLINLEKQLNKKIYEFLASCKELDGYQDFMAEFGSKEKLSLETMLGEGFKKYTGQQKGGEKTKELFRPDKEAARLLWDSWADKEKYGRREAFIREACEKFNRRRSTINNWIKSWKEEK